MIVDYKKVNRVQKRRTCFQTLPEKKQFCGFWFSSSLRRLCFGRVISMSYSCVNSRWIIKFMSIKMRTGSAFKLESKLNFKIDGTWMGSKNVERLRLWFLGGLLEIKMLHYRNFLGSSNLHRSLEASKLFHCLTRHTKTNNQFRGIAKGPRNWNNFAF